MPRGRGVGNADVIQQRARFYGYKRSYLGFCRVYLPTDIEFAYRSYVEHEEDVREQIRKHRGKPLREWRRAFYLDPRFQPTRRMVLRDPYYFVGGSKSEWFKQSWPHFSPENAKANGRLVEAFCHGLRFKPWSSYPDVLVAEKVPLKKVMESLLVDYAFMGPRDRVQGVGTVIRLIELLEEDPEATCVVFLMSGGRQRKRSARSKDDDSIELHQGRSSIGEGKGYPGDEAVKRPDVVTVQIHRLSVESSQGSFRDVPGLAVRLPDVARGKTLLVQDQGLEASG